MTPSCIFLQISFLSPVSLENGKLICKKMQLGVMDASGRAGVTETGEMV